MSQTAHKAYAGAGVAAVVAELAFPLSEIAAAAICAQVPAIAHLEPSVAMVIRGVGSAIIGWAVVYQVPNREKA